MTGLKTIEHCKLAIDVLSNENYYLIENFATGDFVFDSFIKNEALVEKKSGYGITYLVADVKDKDIHWQLILFLL